MNYKLKVRSLALLLAVAAGSSARAQQAQMMPPGKAFTFTNESAASGTGITYQWYRDELPIDGATGASYTVPASEAYGSNVEFKRGAMSSTCPGDLIFSNSFFVSFCGVVVKGVCWASCNVNDYKTFATQPDMYTKFYQWARSRAWPFTGDVSSEWDSTNAAASSWPNSPCPEGWRLPTAEEFTNLDSTGSTWVTAGTRGAAVHGRFFGPNHNTPASCTLPNDMTNCIFLPATGCRGTDGALEGWNNGFSASHYMTGTQTSANTIHNWYFNSGSNFLHNDSKNHGYPIRCVQ